jgi:hypothetical protein
MNLRFDLICISFIVFTPKRYVDNMEEGQHERRTKETGLGPCRRTTTQEILRPQSLRCAHISGYESPLHNLDETQERKREVDESAPGPWPVSSSVSSVPRTIQSSILLTQASSSSVPSTTTLPTPESSKNLAVTFVST